MGFSSMSCQLRVKDDRSGIINEAQTLMVSSDLRYALRGLLRRPALVIVTTIALTIGISANAIMFGVVDQLMLKPPALIQEPATLRRINIQEYQHGKPDGFSTASYRFFDILRGVAAFSDVAIYSGAFFTMGTGADAQMVTGTTVSQNFFHALGVQPALGRAFLPDEDIPPQGPLVAILSDGFWHRVFGGASDIIGRTISLDGKPFTVVGVMPPRFTGVERHTTDVWVPMSAVTAERIGQDWATTKNSFWAQGVARVRPNANLALAEQQATTVYRNELRGWNQPWRDSSGTIALGSLAAGSTATGFSPEAKVAGWLLGVSAIVLLIACANVANLLIARTIERRREIAVRLALGAGRGRLLRQLLIEAGLLAVLATVTALAVARAGARVVESVLLPGIGWDGPVIDGRMLAFTMLVGVLCILLAGFAPAVQAARTSVHEGLKSSSRQIAGGTGRARSVLLALQVSLSLVLLLGAALFVRSLRRVVQRDVGIDIDKTVLVTFQHRRDTPEREIGRWYRQAYERVASLPGVERVGLVGGTVPGRMATGMGFSVPGHKDIEFPGGGPYFAFAANDYLAAIGTKVIRGHSFTTGGAPLREILVNRMIADAYWPGENPIGRCAIVTDDKACSTIVGVVENAMLFNLVNDDRATLYIPWSHPSFKGGLASAMVVRARANTEQLIPLLRPAIQSISPEMPFVNVEPYSQIVAPQLRSWRLGATMFSVFGILATIIAAVGLYSVMAYWASQRTHEIGVRMALGAQSRDIVRLLAVHAARTVGLGIVAGVLIAFGAARWVADLLYETSPREPSAYLVAALTLSIAAVVAIVVPARRVTRVDPATALRSD